MGQDTRLCWGLGVCGAAWHTGSVTVGRGRARPDWPHTASPGCVPVLDSRGRSLPLLSLTQRALLGAPMALCHPDTLW